MRTHPRKPLGALSATRSASRADQTVVVDPLTAAETEELALGLIGRDTPDAMLRAAWVVRESEGNALFIHLIRASNFTVITSYIKVETVVGALLSFIFLNDRLSALGVASFGLCPVLWCFPSCQNCSIKRTPERTLLAW